MSSSLLLFKNLFNRIELLFVLMITDIAIHSFFVSPSPSLSLSLSPSRSHLLTWSNTIGLEREEIELVGWNRKSERKRVFEGESTQLVLLWLDWGCERKRNRKVELGARKREEKIGSKCWLQRGLRNQCQEQKFVTLSFLSLTAALIALSFSLVTLLSNFSLPSITSSIHSREQSFVVQLLVVHHQHHHRCRHHDDGTECLCVSRIVEGRRKCMKGERRIWRRERGSQWKEKRVTKVKF